SSVTLAALSRPLRRTSLLQPGATSCAWWGRCPQTRRPGATAGRKGGPHEARRELSDGRAAAGAAGGPQRQLAPPGAALPARPAGRRGGLRGALRGAAGAAGGRRAGGRQLCQPWREFWGEMRPPDHPMQRALSNAERFAGNYVTVVFVVALLASSSSQPLFLGSVGALQVCALLVPPDFFEVDVRRLQWLGGGIRELGGSWLRLAVVLLAHSLLWLLALPLAVPARRGILVGCMLSFVHALLRTRPWTQMTKEKVKEQFKNIKKSM
ncbi:unnamed protein product, partial [Prorocentrum cordatum]